MCNCIDKIEIESKKENPNLIDPKLSISILFDSEGQPEYYPYLEMRYKKTEKSKKHESFVIIPTYCPFCGKKYNKEK
jgi:hypothetical protein